jgi:hypothetical protein
MVKNTSTKSTRLLVLMCALAATANSATTQRPAGSRHRLIVLADMGNEPDEEQQNIHLLVCSNRIDLEGLIAVTGKYLRKDPRPDLYLKLIDGYEKVLPNLRLHAQGWQSPAYLRGITRAGQNGYGIADVGEGKSSPGSKLMIAAVTKDDPRPIWVVVNAGSNTLAQALWDYRANHSRAEVDAFVAKLRVFENGSQDNAGAWICHHFPNIFWIRSNYQTYAFGGPGSRASSSHGELGPHTWQPYPETNEGQHQRLKEHVMKGHGALGDIYPERRFRDGRVGFVEGGGTVPWLGLLNGLFDIDHPSWGIWSGRFTAKRIADVWSRHPDIMPDETKVAPFYAYREVSDAWTNPETGIAHDNDYVPVWRWRRAMFNDLICRMDWCVKPFQSANHHPVAAVNGDKSGSIFRISAQSGEVIHLDASASTDPDGDALTYSWWVYEEAGTYPGRVSILNSAQAKAGVRIPTGAVGRQIHVILEVKDSNAVALHDYRRIVIDVSESVIEPAEIQN